MKLQLVFLNFPIINYFTDYITSLSKFVSIAITNIINKLIYLAREENYA